MFKSCKVQLIQPQAGLRPGAENANEKWVVVKLMIGGQVAHTGSVFGIFADLADYPLQGRYFFDSNNMTPETNDGYIIGGSEPPHVKFWRYDVKNFILYFSTLETWTGDGAMSMDDNPIVIRNDLELYNVKFTNKGFRPLNDAGYENGFVNVKSWTKPFERRTIYWEDSFSY